MKNLPAITPNNPEEAIRTLLTCMVEHAGGKFVGIQRPIPECGINYSLVMFNAPNGSTLALRFDEDLSTATIREHIRQSVEKFHPKETYFRSLTPGDKA